MRLQLQTLALSPVLLVQGHYVRWKTPRLPEAHGIRQGIDGVGAPLRVLILGDSAAAGVGVDSQQQALMGQLTARLAMHFQVHWCLEATTGHTTEDVVQRISTIAKQPFDVVVTSIGVNDVTRLMSVGKWIALQQQLIAAIRQRFAPSQILMTSVPPMQIFPALPRPLGWLLGQYAHQMNLALSQLLSTQPDCQQITLPLDKQTQPFDMASDGFHPSAQIYARWAEILSEHILKRVISPR